ncbi:MAG: 5-formyltetrahydrofolate cyclo-ligase [Bacteroidetes bacterium]|nr:MAG: 5-formyltetrahydrofolate cyclo-ligase [Bacteroidota bacterium]
MENSWSDILIDTTPADKAEWRRRFRAFRAALSPAEHQRRSRAIADQVRAAPEWAEAQTIHLYWPILERREVDTRPLIEELIGQGKTVVLPVVEPPVPGTPPRMRHVVYRPGEPLRVRRWGVREPSGAETVPVSSLDLVVVPAFGVDTRGHRVGHGWGYYDAFLHHVTAPTMSLVYTPCFVDRLPAEPHDVPVRLIATEDALIRPRPATRPL